MTIRSIGALLCGAALTIVSTGACAQGTIWNPAPQFDIGLERNARDPAKGLTAGRTTTVKSSKSNTSDRMGGGGGAKGARDRNNVGGNESGQQSRQ
jgi:hypothetical protein